MVAGRGKRIRFVYNAMGRTGEARGQRRAGRRLCKCPEPSPDAQLELCECKDDMDIPHLTTAQGQGLPIPNEDRLDEFSAAGRSRIHTGETLSAQAAARFGMLENDPQHGPGSQQAGYELPESIPRHDLMHAVNPEEDPAAAYENVWGGGTAYGLPGVDG